MSLKKMIRATAGIVVTLIIVALVAPFFISADTYKDKIKSVVESATGRTLTIDGKLSISFFPIAGITVQNVTLSNPPGFNDKEPFIKLDEMTLDVAVMPLLHKEIVVKNFVLKKPVIHMHAAGNMKNWVFTPPNQVTRQQMPTGTEPMPREVSLTPIPKSPAGNFMLNNFEIRDGQVYYTNGNAPVIELQKINTSVVIQSTASAAMLKGSAEWNGKEIEVKAGIGTLESLLEGQKAEIKATVTSDLLALLLDGNYERGEFNGKESIKSSSLKELMTWVSSGKPINTPAKLALQTESELRCDSFNCEFTKLHLLLDALDAKGNFHVSWAPPKPSVDMNLTLDQLDINPFLPPEQHAGLLEEELFISDAVAEASERWSNEPIDLSAMNQVNATASLQTGSLKIRNITAGKSQLTVKLQQGILEAVLSPTEFYKGTATFSANVNAAQSPAMFNTNVLLKSVEMGGLLKDLAHNDDMTGVADIQANLKGTAHSVKTIVSTLSGDGQIKIVNGEIKHMSLLNMLHNDPTAFSQPTAQNTVFTLIGGSFAIVDGVASNHDLTMQMQGVNVSGTGNVNLPAYTINYHLYPQLVTTTKDTTGATITRQGVDIPVIIEGSLDHPQFRPDVASAVQNALQDPKQFKEQLKNSKGAVGNLKGLLQGLKQGR